VHDTVRDTGQRVHGRRGCPRGHVPDEGVVGRQDRESQRAVPNRSHLLRHRQPDPGRQLRHDHRIHHHRRPAAILQYAPESLHQQAAVHACAHRAHHDRHWDGAFSVHHVLGRLSNQTGECVHCYAYLH